jgi:hypothetical protein
MSAQLLAAKHQDFLVKASSAALPVPDEDPARLINLREAYNAKNRASDLKRAEREAAKAAERLGADAPAPSAAPAVASLDGYVAELAEAQSRLQAAAKVLAAGDGRRAALLQPLVETVERKTLVLQRDREDLVREASLLRAQLVLRKADRLITGRPD